MIRPYFTFNINNKKKTLLGLVYFFEYFETNLKKCLDFGLLKN